jgi:radical SAM superfamily enzyme YgiQ (UPF0313 family)
MRRLRLFLANVTRPTFLNPQFTPPLGILCLAAYLREKLALDVQVVNRRAEGCTEGEIARRAIAFGADIVGLGCLTPSGHVIPALTKSVRDGLPRALIVLGGPHVSASGVKALEGTAADAAVPGEGERALESIIEARFDGDGDFRGIPGLFWRDAHGEVITNPGVTPHIQDLDSLPFPAYDLIDLKPYWHAMALTPVSYRRYISLMTSRGCPFHCNYCQRVFGNRFRPHSAERIVDEIEYYTRTYGINTVEFLDDVFNLDPERVAKFCELVARRNLKLHFTFPNGFRADILTEETVNALADIGMDQCAFALESGSPRIQQLMGKRLNIGKFLQSVEWAVKRRVFTHGYAMLGFPTETEEDLKRTIDVVVNSQLHAASFFTVTPFPNTEIYSVVEKLAPEKLAAIDYRDMEFCNVRVNLSDVPDEVLYAYQRYAQRRFFMNPARLWRIFRDHPARWSLPRHTLIFARRASKGLFSPRK